ncbi:hypothetical protein GUJ93_ZPchr0003g17798 [Zizania palustris]|uniref:Replication protein A 70 kDa DNA-binding subunit B/D first OB fold domain-containing protein n=1 Tax=Zizania palustris TaxID=103762 RepID=A0A8J5SMS6_ZIZPA|nr:hypothetical protein GUJ93_ZPchr0003g17798 [Zizania palustris]
MAHVLVSQLYCGVDNRPILTRVSRLWNYTDFKDDNKILHVDLLLVDEKGSSIHAQIYPPHIDKFKPLLAEGKVYYIDSFRVKNANRMYKPVQNHLMVTFTRWTTLDERIEVPAKFPSVVFSLTPFEDVPQLVEKNEYFIGMFHHLYFFLMLIFQWLHPNGYPFLVSREDVIGVITEISMPVTLQPKSRQSNSLKRNVQICNARFVTSSFTSHPIITHSFVFMIVIPCFFDIRH